MDETALKPLGLLGQGTLMQICRPQLAALAPLIELDYRQLIEDTTPACSLLVAITDAWTPDMQQAVNAYSLGSGTPWLGLSVEFGQAWLGPCVIPGQTACAACADQRRITAQDNAADFEQIRVLFASSERRMRPVVSWLTSFALQALAPLLVAEVQSYLSAPGELRTRNALLQLDLRTLALNRHPFLAEPYCPACGGLPADTPELATLALQARPKIHPYTYRTRTLTQYKASLQEQYVDKQAGMISSLLKDASNLYANFAVSIHLQEGRRSEVGFGRAFNYEQAEVAAIAEALERYAGMRPTGKRTIVRASHRELSEQALDPRELGLPTNEQYTLPGYPYARYSEDLVCNWVWGYSFQRQRPILVPERCVYYGMHYWTSEPPFVFEISNGCALGSCLEEAILHGILEVAERDSFLMTWYAQMAVPRVDLASARDPLIGLMVERIFHLTGYTVHAFNTTLDQDIPCFWVMGVDEQNRPNMPKALCAAGSHLHPEKALINAIQELAPIIGQEKAIYNREYQRVPAMYTNSSKVIKMEDHSLLYSLPEAFERLEFLYHTPRHQTIQEAFVPFYQAKPYTDLLDDLQSIIKRYLRAGIDIIVVDQTTPEQDLANFRCVKVIMPGMLPMTFGHQARRTTGLPRLLQLPHKLGYTRQPLTEADLNPYPHPFP